MNIIGKQIEAGISLETSRGVVPASVSQWLKNITCEIEVKSENVIDESKLGGLADSQGKRVVKKWVEGNLEGNIHIDPLGYFLKNIYGNVTSSQIGTSGVYTHEFLLEESISHSSLALFIKDGGLNQVAYSNCVLTGFEIKCAVDTFLSFTAEIVGKDETADTSTPSYDEEYDFIGKDITIKVADTEAGLSSATAENIKEFSLKWDLGAIQDYTLGSYNPDDIYNGKMAIEGTLEMNYNDKDFRDLFQNDEAKYMEITAEGVTDLGDGNKPKITILLYKAQIIDWSKSGGADELVSQSVSFKAFYNEADNKQSKTTIQNLTTSY